MKKSWDILWYSPPKYPSNLGDCYNMIANLHNENHMLKQKLSWSRRERKKLQALQFLNIPELRSSMYFLFVMVILVIAFK